MGVSKLSDHERPRLGDHIFKHPVIPAMHAVDPADNLPRPVSTMRMEDSLAPKLAPETFVCMGDESAFVVRDEWGDIRHQVTPERVRRTRDGEYHLRHWDTQQTGEPRLPTTGWEPLRPQCQHYKRVMMAFEHDPEIKHVARVCTAQRGESGEDVSLNDEEVFACEHREPRDFVSEERLRRFDEARVAEGKKADEEWNPEQAVTVSLRPKERTDGND